MKSTSSLSMERKGKRERRKKHSWSIQFTAKSRNSHFISHYKHLIRFFLSVHGFVRFVFFFFFRHLFPFFFIFLFHSVFLFCSLTLPVFFVCSSVECLRIVWNLLYIWFCVCVCVFAIEWHLRWILPRIRLIRIFNHLRPMQTIARANDFLEWTNGLKWRTGKNNRRRIARSFVRLLAWSQPKLTTEQSHDSFEWQTAAAHRFVDLFDNVEICWNRNDHKSTCLENAFQHKGKQMRTPRSTNGRPRQILIKRLPHKVQSTMVYIKCPWSTISPTNPFLLSFGCFFCVSGKKEQ